MKTTGDLQTGTPTTVLSVDDHFIVNVGLKLLIEQISAFRICAQTTCEHEAVTLAAKHQPDLVVLDLVLGSVDGLEIMYKIRQASPKSRFLIYTSLEEETHGWRSLRAGATGYVMKSAPPEEIGRALKEVAEGVTYASPKLQRLMMERMVGRRKTERDLSVLSDRELHVFRLLGSGKASSEIAAEIHVGASTVGTYRERIKQKLLLKDGRELEYAARHFLQTGDLPGVVL